MRRSLALLGTVALLICGCGASSSRPSHPQTTPQSAGGSVHPPGWGLPAAPPSVQRLAVGPLAVMYDTITLSTVPANPFALAGYPSGFWPTFLPLRAAYPRAHVVSIAISTRHHADCLDVEPGDASPGEVPGWVRADKA